MSKRENHWHLLRTTADRFSEKWNRDRGLRTILISLGLVVGLMLTMIFVLFPMVNANRITPTTLPKILAVYIGGLVTWIVWRKVRTRSAYRRAWQHPNPSLLIEAFTRGESRGVTNPEMVVVYAQIRSVIFSLYGDEENAVHALSKIDWPTQAPVLQGAGLFAEVFIELLCRGNARQGLELARRAQGLASYGAFIPGAGAVSQTYETLIAVGEVLTGDGSVASLKRLERKVSKIKFQPMQMLVSLAIVVGRTRDGRIDRAEKARELIRKVAPRCDPLRRMVDVYVNSVPVAGEGRTGPVSIVISSEFPVSQNPAAIKAVLRAARVPLVFAIIMLGFVLFYHLFSDV